MTERLQKFLASAGIGSRRGCEQLIKDGKVIVNGKVAELGTTVSEKDIVEFDNKIIQVKQSEIKLIALNKPEGVLSSSARDKKIPIVYDYLPNSRNQRNWISIGRLDINTSGLLLITNDGKLANHMMHPSQQIDREYSVRILGEVTEDIINNIRKGVKLDDGIAHVDTFEHTGGEGANQWFRIILKEGRNREIRRLVESQNLKVSRLIRTRYGPLNLPSHLKRGQFMEIEKKNLEKIFKMLGMS